MDPHVRWLRRRIAGTVTRFALTWFVAATAAAFVGLALLRTESLLSQTPWALLIGQLAVLAGLGRAALGNPLNVMYLRNEVEQPRQFVVSNEKVGEEIAERFASHQLSPVAVLHETGADEATFDLFQTPRRTVTMARNRHTESVSFCSRLSDDRILITDTFLTVPHQRLVVNRADDDDINALIHAHANALQMVAEEGTPAVGDSGDVFVEALAIEHDALVGLGAVLGPFLHLGRDRAPLRFLVSVDPQDLPPVGLSSPNPQRDLVAQQ